MISLRNYLQFEQDIRETFLQALTEFGKKGSWGIEFNVGFTNSHNHFEVDTVIKYNDRIVAVAEIKASDRHEAFENGKRQARFYKTQLQCPNYIVISANKWGLFGDDDKKLLDGKDLITTNDIIKILNKIPLESEFDQAKWNKEIQNLLDEIMKIDDEEIDKDRIAESIRKLSENKRLHKEDRHISFPQDSEDDFFQSLLSDVKEDRLCRFSSFNSVFRAVSEKSHSMCSIIAMNDKSETSYVSDYFNNHSSLFPGASYLNSADNWNRCFITSCCRINRVNDFTMMRLYGDNAAGVAYQYRIDKSRLKNGFILKPVSYQRENGNHPELDIIQRLLSINVSGYVVSLKNLNIWQHFFKPREYKFEEEVRLLYKLSNTDNSVFKIKWILNSEFNVITPIIIFPIDTNNSILPLTIETITLGPKVAERNDNLEQIKYLMNLNKIENYQNITVEISPISHYR